MKALTNFKVIVGILVGISILYSSFVFVVDQTEYAVKIRLGDPVETIVTPGIRFKVPGLHEIIKFDKRLLLYDADPGSIFTKDKKEMVVDNYAKWRITDPLKFYRTMRSQGQAQARLDDIIYSQVRQVLGQHTLSAIVSGIEDARRTTNEEGDKAIIAVGSEINVRQDLLRQITEASQKEASAFGIEVMDVRIKRADLPAENSRAVFGRMNEERRRDAKGYRSEGEEQSLGIRSAADRDRIKIVSEAEKQSETIRGKADAKAVAIYAGAYGKDPDFFRFQRSHDAYRKTLKEGTTLLMSTERAFFDAFK